METKTEPIAAPVQTRAARRIQAGQSYYAPFEGNKQIWNDPSAPVVADDILLKLKARARGTEGYEDYTVDYYHPEDDPFSEETSPIVAAHWERNNPRSKGHFIITIFTHNRRYHRTMPPCFGPAGIKLLNETLREFAMVVDSKQYEESIQGLKEWRVKKNRKEKQAKMTELQQELKRLEMAAKQIKAQIVKLNEFKI